MRAVWTFWSKPHYQGSGFGWHQPLHHLLAWGLSFRLAHRHYPETMLVTDSAGRALLADELGLPFTHVSTELDRLDGADPALWALGKLTTYSLQTEPFVHLDTDVFLWRPLPGRLETAQVFSTHPEQWSADDPSRGPRAIEDAFARAGSDLPVEWEWARSHWGSLMREANCGIVGGTNVDFLRHYARMALEIALSPRHSTAWQLIADKGALNWIIEQFTLAACLEYHRSHPESPFRGVHARYLFPSMEAAFEPQYAMRLGFTHLLGGSKGDRGVAERLEVRLEREDPVFYRRCVQLTEGV